MRILVWFRSDLRVRDNTALIAACERAGRDPAGGVVGVCTVCPEQWREEHDWGNPKADFVLRSIAALREELAGRNIPLKILTFPRFDEAPDRLLDLARGVHAQALCFNSEYEVNEARRDAAVTAAFERARLETHSYTDQVVFAPGRVKTQQDSWYTVYSPFKKRWRQIYKEEQAPAAGGLPRKQPDIDIASDKVPAELAGFDLREGAERGVRPDLWPAGPGEAVKRLERFLERSAGEYDEQRNYPAIDGTSTLSAYLSVGAISPRQCVEAALSVNQNKLDSGKSGVVAWIEEIIWREFYKHLLVAYPRLSMRRAFRPEMDSVEWSDDESALERWRAGRTGYPIVDAGMRQLAQTGWMHNRLRMIVAMFLTKHLMIDWRLGERHFSDRLVDLDLASNNGGWQWSASTGTDAQPYFRIFNPTTQGERFDKKGEYIRRYVPELAELDAGAIHTPRSAGLFDELDYPEPMVDHKKARERALAAFKAAANG